MGLLVDGTHPRQLRQLRQEWVRTLYSFGKSVSVPIVPNESSVATHSCCGCLDELSDAVRRPCRVAGRR